jgi:hypothetical protein
MWPFKQKINHNESLRLIALDWGCSPKDAELQITEFIEIIEAFNNLNLNKDQLSVLSESALLHTKQEIIRAFKSVHFMLKKPYGREYMMILNPILTAKNLDKYSELLEIACAELAYYVSEDTHSRFEKASEDVRRDIYMKCTEQCLRLLKENWDG